MGIIPSVADSYKKPAFIGETLFGAGAVSIGNIPLKLLIVALKGTTGGTITLDTEEAPITTEDEADTKAAAGSEAARMAYAALRIPGVQLYMACPTPAGGAVAATATATIGGTWTTAGVIRFWVGGELFDVPVGASDTTSNVAAKIEEVVLGKPRLCVTCSDNVAVATFTHKSAGARGNDTIIFRDLTGAPSGLTCVLAGGGAVNGDANTGAGVRFTGGSGVETLTTLLASLATNRYHRIAIAQRDATSIAAWETQLDTMSGPTIGKMQHLVFALNSAALSTAQSVAQTTANDERMQCLWMQDGETPPPELAAVFASQRTITEQSNPNAGYDGYVLPGIAGQRYRPSRPSESTQISALDNGVTPIDTTESGESNVVRSITTKCETSAGDPDYRTLDTAEAVVPDYVRDLLRIVWTTDFVVANPYVRGDPADEEALPPPGVATPTLWNAEVMSQLLTLQEDLILTQVELNPPKTTFNASAGWLESIVPTVPLPLQHSIKVSVRQKQYAG